MDQQFLLHNPLPGSNHLPLQDLLAIPQAQKAFLLPAGLSQFYFQYEVANSYINDRDGGESIWLDGEKQVFTLGWRKTLREKWQLGIDIPWVRHSGGYLDGIIQDWHSFFGLPDGGRENVANDELDYQYTSMAQERRTLFLGTSDDGLGDLRLQLNYLLWKEDARAISVQSQLKLPTGDTDYLRGSGSTDLALGVTWSDDQTGEGYGIGYYVNGGAALLGTGEVLDEMRREFLVYGSFGVAWAPFDFLCFKAQLDAHSEGYDSELKELGESVQLVLGGSAFVGDRWLLDVGIGEDLLVNSAQDVSLFFKLSYLYGTPR